MDTRSLLWPIRIAAGAAVLAPSPAHAGGVVNIANGVRDFLMGGAAVAGALALMVIGYFFITGRASMQSLIPVIIGLVMLASIGAITGIVTGGGGLGAMAGLFVGWLDSWFYSVLVILILVTGYMYWFGKGSYQMLLPVIFGLIFVRSAAWMAGAAGL